MEIMELNKTPQKATFWNMQTKLYVVMFLTILGLILPYIIGYYAFEEVKINGPKYKEIIRDKDLIADLLPPPEYIIESYLVVLQLTEVTNQSEKLELLENCSRLRLSYEERHKVWASTLLEKDELQINLIKNSYDPAIKFYQILNDEFIPLIKDNRKEDAKIIANGKMKSLYLEHRNAIDIVVSLAKERNKEHEESAAKFISKQIFFLSILGLSTILILILGSINRIKSFTKQQKTELEKEEANIEILQLKNALDRSAIVAITDNKGVVKFVNDKFCDISKYKRDELIGQNNRILNSGFHAKEFFSDLWNTVTSGKVWQGEIKNINKEGEYYWVYTTIVPFLDANKIPYQYVAINYDISKEKYIYEKLEHLALFQKGILNGTSYAIITTTPEGIITTFNKGAEELLGYTAEEMINISTPAIFHDINEIVTRAEILSKELGYKVEPGFDVFVLKSRTGIADINDWTYIRKNGTRVTVNLSITTLRNDNQEILGYLGVVSDVTLQKQAQLEILKAKEQAEAASLAKSDFLANMSHEIRTPLNGVIGFSDLLMKTKLNESQTQYMAIVNQSANSLLDIINDILDFSKIEAGKLKLVIERTDILNLTSQIADVVTYQVHQKKIEMLLNISTDLPRFIWADAVRLRQILVNLLGNAVKFTQSGEVEFKVELIKKGSDESTFRFSVRDTGIGIDPKNIDKIFKAFEQEDVSTTRKFGGTGLGLSIVNKLLELMNGSSLQVISNLGQGSIFYFDVSFKTEEGEPIERHDLTFIKNILVVDDNKNNRLIVQEMLRTINIATEFAEDGIEAIMKLKENKKYDVIIMDYHMPDMDGIETIRNIRKNLKPEDQPIILLSSSSDDESVQLACVELGVNQYLIKPIKIQQLFDSLANVFNKTNKVLIEEKLTTVVATGLSPHIIKILVADDNDVNLLLANAIIKKILPNADIYQAHDGLEAISLFIKEKPAFIFMDVQMPELNGYEAATEIRKLNEGSNIPIIALTAGTVMGEKERCLDSGMNAYISKPFTKEAIETVLKKYLNL